MRYRGRRECPSWLSRRSGERAAAAGAKSGEDRDWNKTGASWPSFAAADSFTRPQRTAIMKSLTCSIALLGLFAFLGCEESLQEKRENVQDQKQEAAEEIGAEQRDVQQERQEAAEDNAETSREAAEDIDEEQRDVAEEQREGAEEIDEAEDEVEQEEAERGIDTNP
jgi:hypothetical protein